jgi:ribose 5-phosphate isomerase B
MAAATRATERNTAKRFVVGADDEDDLVQAVITALGELGHQVVVLPKGEWPRVAEQVARAVAGGAADQGVLFCWTGTGTAMAANKVPGVRAALAWDPWIAEGARRWNDANVLVMSLKRTTPAMARRILDAWLAIDSPDTDELANIRMLDDLDRAR